MRLFIGLVLWVGTPFYVLANGIDGVAIVMALFAIGMAIGEWSRYQARERRKAMQRAQERAWTGR